MLAEAPIALEAYQVPGALFQQTSLATIEQHVVWLAINYENNYDYCVPAHTGLAKLEAVPDDLIEALRDGTPIGDPRLGVLRTFTARMVNKRGWATDEDMQAFLEAGYTHQHVLEVIGSLSCKVISIDTNHLAKRSGSPCVAARHLAASLA